jgi:hypothetical protein
MGMAEKVKPAAEAGKSAIGEARRFSVAPMMEWTA